MSKICCACNKEKSLEEFGKYTKSKDGLQPRCKICKREYDNEYHKIKPEIKKQEKLKSGKLREDITKIYIYNYLKDNGCSSCSENRVPALDFHHLKDKKFNISNSRGRSLETVKKEIEKCEILCSNCHRVRTAEELNWYKYIK